MTLDIFINSLTSYAENGIWIYDIKLVVFNYMKGDMLKEVLATLPTLITFENQ